MGQVSKEIIAVPFENKFPGIVRPLEQTTGYKDASKTFIVPTGTQATVNLDVEPLK
jgi:hypothetical protein